MTKQIQTETIASYIYKDEYYSLQLSYNSYKTKTDLESKFVNGEKFKKNSSYYYLDTGNSVKIYFENEFGYYQTIEIYIYSMSNDDNTYSIDNSYKNLLENLNTSEKELSDYSITKQDGYYNDSISYNSYVDENDKTSMEVSYKVPTEKYGSNYDSEYNYQELYLDKSSVSFYEGEITTDISSVKNQTRIRMYFSKIYDLDLRNNAISDLQYPLNQTAFSNVTEDMVNIEINKIQYDDKEVEYYKATSNNNDSYGERIYAYLEVSENLYYIVQIYGGDNKQLDVNMIKDFLPVNIVIK